MSWLKRLSSSSKETSSSPSPSGTSSGKLSRLLKNASATLIGLDAAISRLFGGSSGNEIKFRIWCRKCGREISSPGEARRYRHVETGSIYCDPQDAADREWYIRAALPQAEVGEVERA